MSNPDAESMMEGMWGIEDTKETNEQAVHLISSIAAWTPWSSAPSMFTNENVDTFLTQATNAF
jgi:hypothetical protein